MKGAVKYGDGWLMPGSVAHRLYTDGKMKELAAHMKEVDAKDRKARGVANG